jgi:hypothetical protein
MKQFMLTENYNGYKANTVFQGPYPAKSQGNNLYVPVDQLPGPEGTDYGLFASYVENSPIFKLVTEPETKTPAK